MKSKSFSRPFLNPSDAFYGHNESSATQWLQHYDTKLFGHIVTPKQYLVWLQVLLAGDAEAWAKTCPDAAHLLAESMPTQQTVTSFTSLFRTRFQSLDEQSVIAMSIISEAVSQLSELSPQPLPMSVLPFMPEQPVVQQPSVPEPTMPDQTTSELPKQAVPQLSELPPQPIPVLSVISEQPIMLQSEQPLQQAPDPSEQSTLQSSEQLPMLPEQPSVSKQPQPTMPDQATSGLPGHSAVPILSVISDQPTSKLPKPILPEQAVSQQSVLPQFTTELHINMNRLRFKSKDLLIYSVPLHHWTWLVIGIG